MGGGDVMAEDEDEKSDAESTGVPYPWPEPGKTLSSQSFDHALNAALDHGRSAGLYVYGYRRAVEILFRHMDETWRGYNFLIYPFGFLWRQVIELQLKRIIVEGRHLVGMEEVLTYPKNHRLTDSWAAARAILTSLRRDPPMEIPAVDAVIADLDRMDPDSTGFRYHERKDGGSPTLANAPSFINVRHMHEVLMGISAFFDAVLTDFESYD
jgi:hypothetical protein